MQKNDYKSKNCISIKNLSKIYKTKKENFIDKRFNNKSSEDFWALKNINLQINKGERIGIIGANGAGKTTLLKIICGITKQSHGEIKTQGKIVSLMDLEAGFHPDLTGNENILLNGLLAGMSTSEVEKNRDHIIKFAELENFIDSPFYTYSAGMKFRLAFAIAVACNADILVMDEVFAAGDVSFQKKSTDKLKRLLKKNNDITTIICSHMPFYVWQNADVYYTIINGELNKISNKHINELRKSEIAEWKKIYPTAKVFI
jgi:ABC-type polysaccharide/polyol phosphate transport system ATPase subunit